MKRMTYIGRESNPFLLDFHRGDFMLLHSVRHAVHIRAVPTRPHMDWLQVREG
jgi:hypothetical protein